MRARNTQSTSQSRYCELACSGSLERERSSNSSMRVEARHERRVHAQEPAVTVDVEVELAVKDRDAMKPLPQIDVGRAGDADRHHVGHLEVAGLLPGGIRTIGIAFEREPE